MNGFRWRHEHLTALLLTLLSLAAAGRATADWPMAQHDAKRTSASPGKSNITSPTVGWRAYLGGDIAASALLTHDLDGDGVADIALLEGGRMIAWTSSGRELWRTPLLGLTSLYAIDDFDRDGKQEIVGATLDHVMIFRVSDGARVWTEPDGEMAAIVGVRIADLNGDNKPDLIVKECGCCAVTKTGPWTYAHSFAAGFGGTTLLWSADPIGCGAHTVTVFDGDGDNKPELSDANEDSVKVMSGATGQVLASTPSLGTRLQLSTCVAANVDNTPGTELICTQNVNEGAGGGARRVFALHYVATPSPSLSVLWQRNIGTFEAGDLKVPPNALFDLDGDGSLEMVAAGKDGSGVWTTHILDAATGAIRGTIALRAVAVAPVDQVGGALVLAMDGTTLTAWSFRPTATPNTERQWSLLNAEPVTFSDWKLGVTTEQSTTLLSADWTGDNRRDLLLYGKDANGATVSMYDVSDVPARIARYEMPPSVIPKWYWPMEGAGAAILRNDGLLAPLDKTLRVLAADGGIRAGGYYSGSFGFGKAPIVGASSTNAPSPLFAIDGRGALIRLN
ncbi:MAG TPA: VCBS repeat-containing protein, partial [Polyangiaceae bacterium]|nr:VCBS repeat-containing protein [Polyangiaceae bacterium]